MKFRIGLGTIITLILALMVGGYSIYKQRAAAQQSPVVERRVQGVTRGVAPTPEFALRHKTELHLTTAQEHRITSIAAAYRADIAPVKKQLDLAVTNYGKYLERTAKSSRPETQQVMEQSSEVQHLSGVMASVRHTYWQQVLSELTKTQQNTVQHLVTRATITDFQ